MTFRAREIQIERNRESQDRWQEYSHHRDHISRLLNGPDSSNGSLLVVGAGNCNDLNLRSLLDYFTELHLVDLDAEALSSGVQRQNLAANTKIALHGGIDVTGIADQCSTWDSDNPPGQPEVADAIRRALSYTWPHWGEPFDVGASIGLLSQLAEMIIRSLGERNPQMMELLSAVRLRHMQQLMERVRPGGKILLITEVVSSASCPELAHTAPSDLDELVRRLINERNFFTGMNPAVLESLWRQSPVLVPLVERVRLSSTWLWNFGPRTYACIALSGVRRQSSA